MSQQDETHYPPPPDPWGTSNLYYHDLSLLARGVFAHRKAILAHYPWVPLPNDDPGSSTPVAALILAWERWDYVQGDCPACGGRALGLTFGGLLSIGVVSGVCTRCARGVSRSIGGMSPVLGGARQSVEGTPYKFSFGSGTWRWKMKGIPAGLVAVLGELGVDELPTPNDGADEPTGGAYWTFSE